MICTPLSLFLIIASSMAVPCTAYFFWKAFSMKIPDRKQREPQNDGGKNA